MKQVYIKDKNNNYYNDANYEFLVGPLKKEDAKPMSEENARAIIAVNSELIIEEVKKDDKS